MALFVHMYDVYGEYYAPPDDCLSAMFRDHDFYSRLREFTLDGEIDVLSYIFPEDTPRPSRLVSLSIVRSTAIPMISAIMDQIPPNPPVPELLVESSSESLRRLSISACTLDFDQLPIIRQLTHLSLTALGPGLTVKKLLFFLQANPGLEELVFDYTKSPLKANDDEGLPLVLLPHLRKLRATLLAQDLAHLFERLRIVSEVEEVEVTIEGFESSGEPLPETICHWFNDVVSPRAVQHIKARPAFDVFRSAGMKYVQKSDSVQHTNPPGHTNFVELRFGPSELIDLLSLQVLRNATRLELFHDDLSTSRYLGVFEAASVLQELVIWAGRECNFVRALLPTAQDSQEDVGSGSLHLSYVPLPNLSYLRIIEADFRNTEDENDSSNETVILNFVRQRQLLGLGLRRLELICCSYVYPDWVDDLRSFVPEVFWDERDGAGGIYSDDSDDEYWPSSPGPEGSESSGPGWESHGSDEGGTIVSESSGSGWESYSSDEEDTVVSESSNWILGVYRRVYR